MVGLAATFTIAIVLLAQLVKGVGLASGAARTLAIVVLIVFGVALLIPDVTARLEAPLSRLARFGPKTRGTGFWSGLAVGGALGFVCAPCAGPILAAVTSVSASSGANARVVAVAIAVLGRPVRGACSSTRFAGRAVIDRIRRVGRGYGVQRALGVVLLATGVLMIFNVDVRFEEALAKDTQPAGDPGRPDPLARELERGSEAAGLAAPDLARSSRPRRRRRPSRCRPRPSARSRSRASRPRRCPTSETPPSSPTPRTGSTRPATVR